MWRRRSGARPLVVASFALVTGVLALPAAGCGRTERREAPAVAADAPADAAIAVVAERDAGARAAADAAAGAGAGAGATAGADAFDEAAFASAVPTSARSIGHTSVVLKLELSNGKKAAFKPASRRGPVRYKGEIAAHRLARALGLPNVPPALFRTLEAALLAGAKDAGELIVKDGAVKGALIPWIDGLAFLSLERAPLSGEWKQWLKKDGVLPDGQRELARQISDLVAFDFVTGNWDRWSGGNVGIDERSGTLLFIDNDGAFFEVPPQGGLKRNETLLEGVGKLSRGLVSKLRALDEPALARALGEESPGVPLLSAKALAGVAQRRRQLLEIVDAKLAAGTAAFAFP